MNQTTSITSGTSGTSFTPGTTGASASRPQTQGPGRETLHRWAGMAHDVIDKVEEKLVSVGGSSGAVDRFKSKLSSTEGVRDQARQMGEQAREYGGQLRESIRSHPLQTAGIATAVGVVFSKLFLGSKRKRVELVEVTAYLPQQRHGLGERMHRLVGSSDRTMHRLSDSGQAHAKKLGAKADAMTSRLWHDTRKSIPSGRQVLDKSHEYGSVARHQLQEHPLLATGLALGIGALVVTWAMRREDY